MNEKVVFSCVLLGLTFPVCAFASVTPQASPLAPNHEQFNMSGTIEIAQQYLSSEEVAARLYDAESQIRGIASNFSGDRVRWDSISIEYLGSQRMKLNLHGKIMIPGKPPIRVGLYLQRNDRGYFRFVNYDYSTGRRCRVFCERQVREKLQNLPSEFPYFEEVLDRIIA